MSELVIAAIFLVIGFMFGRRRAPTRTPRARVCRCGYIIEPGHGERAWCANCKIEEPEHDDSDLAWTCHEHTSARESLLHGDNVP
jgi:hypothetical protein